MRDSRWWPFYFQRLFMRAHRRAWFARKIAHRRPQAGELHRIDPEDQRRFSELATHGITHIAPPLTRDQCAELVTFFSALNVYDPYRKEIAPFKPLAPGRHPNGHIAHHYPEDIVRAPHLLAIANSPEVLSIVSRFLGCKPTVAYMAAWWSYATPIGAQQAEFFHRDVDDWRFVKLFVYLTDVDANSGPHVYVTESTQSPALAAIRRFSDDEVTAHFKPEQIQSVTGHAGDAFLEDTFGIHKGQPVQRGQRLIFQVVYSLCQLPYGPNKPVASCSQVQSIHPQQALDPWINRFYLSA